MKSVLFLCESYYYKASPNGLCVQMIAEEMLSSGISVDVITLFSDKSQKAYENIGGANVYRVDPGYIKRMLYLNGDTSEQTQCKKYKRILKLSALSGAVHALRYPYLTGVQVRNFVRKGRELIAEKKYDAIVGVYQQIHPVLAALKLKKENPDIKTVLYTLDAISGGWVPEILHSRTIPMKSLRRWERYFFSRFDSVFAMESHRSHYEKDRFYDPFAHKFDYLDIPLFIPNYKATDVKQATKLLVYTGSMHRATANPKYLLDLLPYLNNVRVNIYGKVSDEIREQIENCGYYNDRIFLCGLKTHDEILDIQRSADVLLNFGNSNPNMIPCKIFEYMSAGRRILSFTHSAKDSSLPYINKYPLGMIVSEDSEKIEENAKEVRDFIESEVSSLNEAEQKKLFEKNTPDYFIKRLFKE